MKWVSSFSYLPINYSVVLAEVKDQTQRVIFDNNLNGSRVRLRFSNRYSKNMLTLQRVTIGIAEGNCVKSVKEVTLKGDPVICLEPGEECYSDEIELIAAAGNQIAVSTYVKETQPVGSICALWSQNGAGVSCSKSGDFTNGDSYEGVEPKDIYEIIREDPNPVKGLFFYGFTGVQVLTEDSVKTIAAFGDSITHMSYVTNALYKRLFSAYPGKVTLLNRGIGGNRLLHDATRVEMIPGHGSCFGEAGIKRFERDLFGEEDVDTVLVLEGINDIMHPIQFDVPDETVKPEELEHGYKQLAAIAHRHGAKIFGATITPCGSSEYSHEWMKKFEEIRIEVNRRIRSGLDYDGFFDYDEAVRDEKRPGYMKENCHIWDGLHPNDEGGARMAAQIDLKKLME